MVGILRLAIFALAAICCLPAVNYAQAIKVTLLGTGCPPPVMNRFGPSILVEAGGHKFLFDAGRGAMQRLTQLKIPWRDVSGVFLTHLHSNHVVGFPDLWLTGWLTAPGRDEPLRVWGPAGTAAMMGNLSEAFAEDIRIRIMEDKSNADGATIIAAEVTDGMAIDTQGVKITAFLVDHGPVTPAFGYRVDFAGHSVVLSGDTKPSENLIIHAQGADVLIHEVVSMASLQEAGYPPSRIETIVGHHTSPEQAGELFSRVNPKLAVYSHIVRPDATEQQIIPPTRKKYSGRLEMGEDLMVISIGDKVEVRRQEHSSQ